MNERKRWREALRLQLRQTGREGGRVQWRKPMHQAAAGLALLMLTACSPPSDGVREATLAVLVQQAEQFDGARVATEGRVRHFETPLHYWIEDEDLNRVEVFPHEDIAPYLGETVRIIGHFEYSSGEGRRLTLERLERPSMP